MMINIDCQLKRTWSHPGDTSPGVSIVEFLDWVN